MGCEDNAFFYFSKIKEMFNSLASNDKSPSPLLQVLFDELTAKWSKKLGISGLYNITAQKSFPVKFWCVDHPRWSGKNEGAFLVIKLLFHYIFGTGHNFYEVQILETQSPGLQRLTFGS